MYTHRSVDLYLSVQYSHAGPQNPKHARQLARQRGKNARGAGPQNRTHARQRQGKIAMFRAGYSRLGARVFRIWGSGIQGYSEVFEGIRHYGIPFSLGKNGI